MGIVIVEVCDLNPICSIPFETLETDYPGVSVLVTSCLGQCELCSEGPYAFVNGRLLVDVTIEGLLASIRQTIEEELETLGED